MGFAKRISTTVALIVSATSITVCNSVPKTRNAISFPCLTVLLLPISIGSISLSSTDKPLDSPLGYLTAANPLYSNPVDSILVISFSFDGVIITTFGNILRYDIS